MADRIVVMRDGHIEQIGTPLQLFDRPRNRFVAQFIGSPSMNLIEGKLVRNGAGDFVDAHGHLWPVAGLNGTEHGRAVTYGIRPSDLAVGESHGSARARVVVVEPTGAETELMVDVGGQRIVAVHPGRTNALPESLVGLVADPSRGHVFDQASGMRLN